MAIAHLDDVGKAPRAWHFTKDVPQEQGRWARLKGHEPKHPATAYWIVRCGREIIKNHGDIWSPAAMEMYVAIFRLVMRRRKE
ncbi:MAG: hypothetical protein ACOYMN_24655 [Roseimicrobium sp.]